MPSNNLHIIIEGADKAGKSTVCEILSKGLGLRVIRLEDMDDYYKKGITEEVSKVFNKTLVQFKDVGWVADRGFPSSLVYSRYFMRKADLRYINDIAKELDARIFILDVNPRKVDDLLSYHQQEEVRNVYHQLASKYNWKVLPCTGQTPEQICATIIKELGNV